MKFYMISYSTKQQPHNVRSYVVLASSEQNAIDVALTQEKGEQEIATLAIAHQDHMLYAA